MLSIYKDKCTLCGKCLEGCPIEGALFEEKDAVAVDMEKCTLCSICVSACPEGAIEIQEKEKTADTSSYSDVWIFAETYDGKIKPVVFELIGAGRNLADELDDKLCAVLLGGDVDDLAADLADRGVDKVYVSKSSELRDYSPEPYVQVLSAMIKQHRPEIMLIGATHQGRDLAPSLAANMGLGLTADCTGLSINEDGLLLQTRPAFGGNVMADIICPNTRPQMATVRPNVMQKSEVIALDGAEIVEFEFNLDQGISTLEVLKEFEGTEQAEIGLEEAEIIVSGGRGIKSQEDFQILESLAEALGGIVGCSRPIVEKGWLSKARQVGQSGKTVSPKIYIACGISGAVQHKVGIRNSDIIIAINRDEDAPIFDLADYAVVGDLYNVVPELTERIKHLNE